MNQYEELKMLPRHKELMKWNKSDLAAHSIKYQRLFGKLKKERSIIENYTSNVWNCAHGQYMFDLQMEMDKVRKVVEDLKRVEHHSIAEEIWRLDELLN